MTTKEYYEREYWRALSDLQLLMAHLSGFGTVIHSCPMATRKARQRAIKEIKPYMPLIRGLLRALEPEKYNKYRIEKGYKSDDTYNVYDENPELVKDILKHCEDLFIEGEDWKQVLEQRPELYWYSQN